MPINLKNYTTVVTADKSIALIEKLLVDFGATSIVKEYEELKPLPGRICSALSFVIVVEEVSRPIKLPANVAQVARWLRGIKPNVTDKTVCEQAYRIAWKQQYEFLHLQLGTVEMQQRELMAVFLSDTYNQATGQTFYQQLKEGGFKLLTQ